MLPLLVTPCLCFLILPCCCRPSATNDANEGQQMASMLLRILLQCTMCNIYTVNMY